MSMISTSTFQVRSAWATHPPPVAYLDASSSAKGDDQSRAGVLAPDGDEL